MDLFELLDTCPDITIADSFIVSSKKIRDYKKIVCAISGGSDSDIMLDICTKLDPEKKITYVWFNTGLEYQATKDHLKFLENKYGIEIKVIDAVKPIPYTCRKIGQPFLSKQLSWWIGMLQNRGFKWEDEPIEVLLEKYCDVVPEETARKNPTQYFLSDGKYYRGVVTPLRWWTNDFPKKDNGSESKFNIRYYAYLKEYMIANPPDFLISHKCCDYAKKKPVHKFISENDIELNMYGVRKAEGGVRSTAYKNCFTDSNGGTDEYRPIFWYGNDTKRKYEEAYGVTHSACYSEYGLDRTGCAGCPFGKRFEQELEVIEKYEPKLFKAVNNIFGKSYEYTREYYKFRKDCKAKEDPV